jgi:hypothetical protein
MKLRVLRNMSTAIAAASFLLSLVGTSAYATATVGDEPQTSRYPYSKLIGVVAMDDQKGQVVCGMGADGSAVDGLLPCDRKLQQQVAMSAPKGATSDAKTACFDGGTTLGCAVVAAAVTCFGTGIVGGALYGYEGKTKAVKEIAPLGALSVGQSAVMARAVYFVMNKAAVFASGSGWIDSGWGQAARWAAQGDQWGALASASALPSGTTATLMAEAIGATVATCAVSGAAGAYAGYKIYYVFSRSKNDVQKRN